MHYIPLALVFSLSDCESLLSLSSSITSLLRLLLSPLGPLLSVSPLLVVPSPPTCSALSLTSLVLGISCNVSVSSASGVGSDLFDFPSRLLYASAASDMCLNHLKLILIN